MHDPKLKSMYFALKDESLHCNKILSKIILVSSKSHNEKEKSYAFSFCLIKCLNFDFGLSCNERLF